MGLSHTVSGDIASFRTPSIVPIESLKFHFLPKQASGTPSPENPIPIEGWTGLNGRRAGKNIGDVMWSANGGDADAVRKLSNNYGTSINTLDYIYPNGPIIVTQTKWDNPSLIRSYMNGFVAPIIPNLQRDGYYDVSFKVTNITSNPLNASLSDMALSDPYGNGYLNPAVIDNVVIFKNYRHRCKDTSPNKKHFELRIGGMNCTISELMVTPANKSDGVFEPYSGEQIPITFPDGQTIYGGYIDPVAGEIVAEYAIEGPNSGTWTIGSSRSYQWSHTKGRDAQEYFKKNICTHWINNKHTYYSQESVVNVNENGALCIGKDYFVAAGFDYDNLTSSQIAEYLEQQENNGTPFRVCYPLLNPIHIPVTSQDLKAFLDHNNFWSDANDITEVTYAVTESKDILATRKKAMDFDHAHHKKVKWNQLVRDGNFTGEKVDASKWAVSRSDMGSLSISDNIATWTCTGAPSYYYQTGITWSGGSVSSYNYLAIPWNHLILVKCKARCTIPCKVRLFALVGSGAHVWSYNKDIEANTWTDIVGFIPDRREVPTGEDDGFIKRFKPCITGVSNISEVVVGTEFKIKELMAFDLTQMFGLRNEPQTVAEFERICEINGIDLTTYQPYDAGSDRWLIVP